MLTDKAVRAAAPSDRPRKLADGRGLYLLRVPNGSRLWRVKYRYATRSYRGRRQTCTATSAPAVARR